MLSESWLKGKHPCLVFVRVHIETKGVEEKADDDQDQESGDSDRQEVQGEDSPAQKNLNMNWTCNDPSHMISTLSAPNFLVISWGPEIESH